MKRFGRRSILVLLIFAAVAALGATAWAIYSSQKSPYEISPELESQVGFDIILPSQLPAGSKIIEQPNYDSTLKLLVTKIQLNAGSAVFSQQKNPGTDLKQIDAQETFLTEVGAVYVLKGEKGRLQAIVETSDSWIIVNSVEENGRKTFRELINSLTAV